MMRSMTMALAGLLCFSSQALAQQNTGKQAFALVESQGSRIVSLRVVLSVDLQGRSTEVRLNARGVLVSETGLVLTATEVFAPSINVQGRAVRPTGITPTDVKVIIGNEEKEYDAFQSGRDTKLGLAFVQISDLGDRKLPFVDFSSAVNVAPGTELVTVNRLERGFDYTPYFHLCTITGQLKKPRAAFLVDRPSGIGLPAFTLRGQVVGVHARLESSIVEGAAPPRQQCILPGRVVAGVIRTAARQAENLLEDLRAGRKPELPPADEEPLPGDDPLPGDE